MHCIHEKLLRILNVLTTHKHDLADLLTFAATPRKHIQGISINSFYLSIKNNQTLK